MFSIVVSIVVALILLALFLWALPQFPLDAQIVKIIRVVLIVAAVLWILAAITGYGPVFPIARWRS